MYTNNKINEAMNKTHDRPNSIVDKIILGWFKDLWDGISNGIVATFKSIVNILPNIIKLIGETIFGIIALVVLSSLYACLKSCVKRCLRSKRLKSEEKNLKTVTKMARKLFKNNMTENYVRYEKKIMKDVKMQSIE